ncbi:uncharacterized protein, partial [Parasteatoda tepidariorum]|uniref:uncharacterized protein n=1 Tax=Parasteatoda tepidariorum TaxID=114398 RepID=UPI0039BC5754
MKAAFAVYSLVVVAFQSPQRSFGIFPSLRVKRVVGFTWCFAVFPEVFFQSPQRSLGTFVDVFLLTQQYSRSARPRRNLVFGTPVGDKRLPRPVKRSFGIFPSLRVKRVVGFTWCFAVFPEVFFQSPQRSLGTFVDVFLLTQQYSRSARPRRNLVFGTPVGDKRLPRPVKVTRHCSRRREEVVFFQSPQRSLGTFVNVFLLTQQYSRSARPRRNLVFGTPVGDKRLPRLVKVTHHCSRRREEVPKSNSRFRLMFCCFSRSLFPVTPGILWHFPESESQRAMS